MNVYIGYTQILGECAFLCAFCWLRYLAGIGSHEVVVVVVAVAVGVVVAVVVVVAVLVVVLVVVVVVV